MIRQLLIFINIILVCCVAKADDAHNCFLNDKYSNDQNVFIRQSYEGISLYTNQAPLDTILKEISRTLGLELMTDVNFTDPISLETCNKTLPEILRKIARGKSYVLNMNQKNQPIGQLWFFNSKPDGLTNINREMTALSVEFNRLRDELHHTREYIRFRAVNLLADFEKSEAIDALFIALFDDSPLVMASAANAIIESTNQTTASTMEKLFNIGDPQLKLAIIENYSGSSYDSVIQLLERAALDENIDISNAAIMALQELTEVQ